MTEKPTIPEIRARLEAITPPPWNLYRYRTGGGRICIDDAEQVGRRRELIADMIGDDPEGVATIYNEGDREFFVNAPTDIAFLLDRLSAVREYVDDPGNWSALDGRRQVLLDLIDGSPNV